MEENSLKIFVPCLKSLLIVFLVSKKNLAFGCTQLAFSAFFKKVQTKIVPS
jgi:hypothetical protein